VKFGRSSVFNRLLPLIRTARYCTFSKNRKGLDFVNTRDWNFFRKKYTLFAEK